MEVGERAFQSASNAIYCCSSNASSRCIGENDGLMRRLQKREYVNRGHTCLVHVDDNDKLKPFGICIHGAIDGFSDA